ncbi:hypothetical protein QUF74_02215 [Candidatus Halobeggiatoa sp. HSG11]|nr:hypothetical protein [Candidatus Halobeggiatoa sp. HSG11]
MSDKIYKVILLGKIADGYDIEIAHEKLALVFDIDLKKIPKLLKKPTVIRKELTHSVAVRYKNGLDKIGVLCKVHPPLETGYVDSSPTAPEEIPESIEIKSEEPEGLTELKPEESEELEKVEQDEQQPVEEIIEFAPTEIKLGGTLRVIDVRMSFGSMMLLIIKIVLASIPTMIILGGIIFLLYQAITMIISFI